MSYANNKGADQQASLSLPSGKPLKTDFLMTGLIMYVRQVFSSKILAGVKKYKLSKI